MDIKLPHMPQNSRLQKDALINEYKGNLFEYLVGAALARIFNIESTFIKGSKASSRNNLSFYERKLRELAPGLLKLLPLQALSLANKLRPYLPSEIEQIWVIGKINCQLDIKNWNEADLLIKSGDQIIPISVKLCKTGSYINTKSGGVGSFLTKYFSDFKRAPLLQKQLSEIVDVNFQALNHSLYEEVGLEFDGGNFHNWRLAGLTELPGQLTSELKTIVTKSYVPINDFIYEAFSEFYSSDPQLFTKSLMPILGVSGSEILQAILFHRQHRDYAFQTEKSCFVKSSAGPSKEFENLHLRKADQQRGYFYIDLSSMILQVRIKPMNKFTSKSFKVNCSVKYSEV